MSSLRTHRAVRLEMATSQLESSTLPLSLHAHTDGISEKKDFFKRISRCQKTWPNYPACISLLLCTFVFLYRFSSGQSYSTLPMQSTATAATRTSTTGHWFSTSLAILHFSPTSTTRPTPKRHVQLMRRRQTKTALPKLMEMVYQTGLSRTP